MYVNVRNGKTEKKVRWYTEVEYRRMYPEVATTPSDPMMTFNARHAFGFGDAGYITLYRGDSQKVEKWARHTWPPLAWRNQTFGFYTPSTIIPDHPPEGVEMIKLTWDEVKQDDIHMKSHEEVSRYVSTLIGTDICKTNNTEYEVGTWVEKEVTIAEKATEKNRYGEKYTYTMSDSEGNVFVWETGSKDYMVDAVVKLKMKIKEVKEDAVIVWYCKEVK